MQRTRIQSRGTTSQPPRLGFALIGAPRPTSAPDLKEAARFLAALAPGETAFTFQTFDDTDNKRGDVIRVLHGTLDEHAKKLAALNAQQAGVFLTVNATDLKGRARANIIRVRAVWVDLDGTPLGPVRACALKPHIVIESSPGRWHAYWLACDVALDQFNSIQRAIIDRFNGDKSINDLPRVMRLPGFIHYKDAPALTRILELNEAPPYTAAQLVAEFPPALEPSKRALPATTDGAKDGWIIPALQALGLYVGDQGDGKHGIRCPWEDGSHTTTGTVYFEPGARGKGGPGFKCFSCEATGQPRTLRHLKVWLRYETGDVPLTDDGNAQRFVAQHGEGVRFCKPLDAKGKGWFIWDGLIWRQDTSNKVVSLATDSARRFRASIADESNPVRKDAMYKWTKRAESLDGIRAVVALAQAEQQIALRPEQLDANPMLLTVANGTLDLSTGALREARRDDLITRASPVAFDAAATCPKWKAQMQRTFAGDAALIAYMRRVLGFCLAGLGSERFFIWHGNGANGKSTITEILDGILGNADATGHVGKLNADAIEPRKNPGAIRNDLAGCYGARVVLINEPKRGVEIDEGMVKELTTPRSLFKARFLFGEFFTFKPTFKIILCANHKPEILGTDEGIWRRIHYVPFTVQIPQAEQITGFSQQLLATEAPGILNWMLAGCLDWQQRGGGANGLAPPRVVIDSTAEWRATADWFAGFLEENVRKAPGEFVSTVRLLSRLHSYCEARGRVERWDENVLADAMKARGYEKGRSRQDTGSPAMGFKGIELIEVSPRGYTPDPEVGF